VLIQDVPLSRLTTTTGVSLQYVSQIHEIVAALRTDRPGLTVVGDDLQAIYGFRSASAEHLLSFCERFPDAAVVKLEDNYRSTQPILDVGNLIAAQAERRVDGRLAAGSGGSRMPRSLRGAGTWIGPVDGMLSCESSTIRERRLKQGRLVAETGCAFG
jgi:hypothetical protein